MSDTALYRIDGNEVMLREPVVATGAAQIKDSKEQLMCYLFPT